jgi:hypothetical protein
MTVGFNGNDRTKTDRVFGYLATELGFVPKVKFRERLCSRSPQTSGNRPNSGESGYGFGTKHSRPTAVVSLRLAQVCGQLL